MTFTNDSEVPRGNSSTGKLVVLAMIAVALLAATFAWWWNFNRGRKTLAFFGPQAARLIRTAPKVEILIVDGQESAENSGTSDNTIQSAGHTYSISRRINISKAPGLIHARASLLSDASFRDDPPNEMYDEDNTYFVRFADEATEVILRFTSNGAIDFTTSRESKQLIKKTADGWRQFIERNVKQAEL